MFEHILALLATVTILLCFIVNIEVEILNFIHDEFKLIFNHVDDINVQGKHTVAIPYLYIFKGQFLKVKQFRLK